MQNVKDNQVETNVQFLTAEDAIAKIPANGATMMVGGFGDSGIPEYLLRAVMNRDEVTELTIMSNNITEGSNLNELFLLNRIKKAIGSYFTTNKAVMKAYNEGRIDIELIPQGTFSEALRLGGSGIPAFYTPTSAGTELAEGKETRYFNNREYVLEHSLSADVALIKAYKADKAGNLIYRKTARNFNPLMAMAADLTIVEVEEIVEVGELDPESIVTPFIFVDVIVKRVVNA
ncbi:CoA transferase subunit A [Peribacillus asahii]|uniref:Acyl CoA:acetate/3-ketoacid CoA transferase, alpha subunit n=1 Tax=Peribacillus asahii TaxID=228899 RepID=A0A3T0KR10_9BACI|nr:CoA transferase subunit A [Peribacillus asahii]AZV42839.1 acyl CoA:acetate/3-ketoacid CoA transferase, alpha subunit [Peribacillus asahii]USK87074.1 CoA transferase subunit A [Peribacillus asahii]